MSDIVLTERDGPIFRITLNRPAKRNAISDAMMNALDAALDQAESEFNHGARVAILRAQGRVFSSGIDLEQFAAFDAGIRDNLFPFTARYQAVASKIARHSLPVICVMHGYCLGLALELALACDFRLAAQRTRLGLPETRLGIIPDVGGTTRLVDLVGPARARNMILTGSNIDAAKALEWGLLDAVYPKAELEAGVADLVAELCASAPLAVSYAKRVINDIADHSRGLQVEAWAQAQLFRSQDFHSATKAMLDKTYPSSGLASNRQASPVSYTISPATIVL